MSISEEDRNYLSTCIEISARSLDDPTLTPFGALVVMNGSEIGRGVSSVIANNDPTSHAEVAAIRAAGAALGTHEMPDAIMYCSGSPCPMCLTACYWAGIRRIVTAASLDDSAKAGFEDTFFFEQLRLEPEQRFVVVEYVDGELKEEAASVLMRWKEADREH